MLQCVKYNVLKMQYNVLKNKNSLTLGIVHLKGFLPRNWIQFADDAVVVTSLEGENEILLNLFSNWCRWSEMTIKASKCHSFDICKKGTTSTQYKPKLYLDNALVPPVRLNDCFTHIGRRFHFKMSDDKHKNELIETITDLIEIN